MRDQADDRLVGLRHGGWVGPEAEVQMELARRSFRRRGIMGWPTLAASIAVLIAMFVALALWAGSADPPPRLPPPPRAPTAPPAASPATVG